MNTPERSEAIPQAGTSTIWTVAAFLAAAAGLAGSLYLSLGMNLIACPLCFYQRTFIMGVVGVMTLGLLIGAKYLSLLALPSAVGGLGVAAFHVYLEMNGTLECPAGLFGPGTAPQQSLAIHLLLVGLLLADPAAAGARRLLGGLAAVVAGVLFTYGAIASAPKLPDPPLKPYDAEKQPLNTCRRPFSAS